MLARVPTPMSRGERHRTKMSITAFRIICHVPKPMRRLIPRLKVEYMSAPQPMRSSTATARPIRTTPEMRTASRRFRFFALRNLSAKPERNSFIVFLLSAAWAAADHLTTILPL